jgi:hypothetical protein
MVKLRVVIEHVKTDGCGDNFSDADFFANVLIDGQNFHFDPIDGKNEIFPSSWTAEKDVDIDPLTPTPVKIHLEEADSGLNGANDGCDINPAGGTELNFTVDLSGCSLSSEKVLGDTLHGDVTGRCAESINTHGNGDGDGNAFFQFRVEVVVPTQAAGLAVRCTHSPLWPQPGDDVTITIESLDGSVQVGDTVQDLSLEKLVPPVIPPLVDHKKIADDLQIWASDQPNPTFDPNFDTADAPNRSTNSYTIRNVQAGDLTYGCQVKQGTAKAFTGWRKVRVGPPAQGTAIPVIYTGDRANRIDVVFIADKDDYTGVKDPNFLADAASVLKGAYFGQDYFLANQFKFNFWLADQTGDAVGNDATCLSLTPPANFATDYSWHDAAAILHRDTFRDCASIGEKLFSSEPSSLSTVLHETGHAAFGLSDEYCCDSNYFEASPFPNVWGSETACQTDAPNLGRPESDCRSFTDDKGGIWFTSEPDLNDLMNLNQRPPQAADIRRMDWQFRNCDAGTC